MIRCGYNVSSSYRLIVHLHNRPACIKRVGGMYNCVIPLSTEHNLSASRISRSILRYTSTLTFTFALCDNNAGATMNGTVISNLRFADDIAAAMESER